ncbi:hypothetical protein SAMN06893096_10559 [Geodermatophilus pulveris]|uniref:Uncharacterized protein n=1 Tax=Geodermatophilus pulveris TaxID=1564159 RepID=A0A239FGN8_9ACTN|nr:hypothetical protein [Geodermatophilus pulveris]SNS55463.1 hypothetical protein SAMN06893096_10559 [Geodermatophilus pulveris]
MTEVPGTDRDQAGENVLQETPLAPEDVAAADDEAGTDEDGQTGDGAKPQAGSTELGT